MTDIVERLRDTGYETAWDAADEIDRLREELHYSKGTCELAIKHRDAAEVEIEQLRESDKRHHDLWKAAVDGLRNYKAEIKRLRALWAP